MSSNKRDRLYSKFDHLAGNSTIRVRLLIGLLCGILTAVIQLYLRPAWRDYSPLTGVLLGSLPNFLAVVGLALIFLEFKKPTQHSTTIIAAALVGILTHEVFTGSTPTTSFGDHFDWNDIVASELGAVVAYRLDQQLKRAPSKPT